MASLYTRAADRARLAKGAMAKLDRTAGEQSIPAPLALSSIHFSDCRFVRSIHRPYITRNIRLILLVDAPCPA